MRNALNEVFDRNDLIIAFGDIHGCFQAAAKAVEISEELDTKAIFLSDYVDRGPSAVKTLQILIDAKMKHPDWIYIRGNHDQMLLDLIDEKAKPRDIGIVLDGEFENGLLAEAYL
uniref:metallophosphoesterase n=1 Tax=Algoriphagus sp. TaxID=1872435 RepID=UPI0025860DDD|nr:metallophosphoesterase [Algoriphagus sp.]